MKHETEDNRGLAYEDVKLLEELYMRYKPLMCYEIRKIVKTQWDVEDVLHITVMKLIPKISKLRELEEKALVVYIAVTAKHSALNYVRDNKRLIDSEMENMELVQARSFEEKVEAQDISEKVALAMKKLPERERTVLESKYILEKSNEEIAKELGVSTDSVRMALTRARRALKKIIDRMGIT